MILTHCKNTVSALTLGAMVTVTACSPFSGPFSGSSGPSSNYCVAHPGGCLVIGAIVVAGIAIASGGSTIAMSPYVVSDERLKTDIQKLKTLENGINIYAFRYRGDDRVFAGVMAQELMDDPRYSHAVMPNAKGYFVVEYHLLPLKAHDMDVMIEAGLAAAKRLNAT